MSAYHPKQKCDLPLLCAKGLNRSRGNALRATLMQAHHGNGRNSRRSAIGGHPSARCLIRLCTLIMRALAGNKHSCREFVWVAFVPHASAILPGRLSSSVTLCPTTFSCDAAHASLWNHKPSKMYFPLLTQDPCQQVMVVAISRREWFSREAPSQLSLCASLRKLQDSLNS